MPDLSALNIKDISLNGSMINDSHNFNIDDILMQRHVKEGSNDKTVADFKGRHQVNAFRTSSLAERLVDINSWLSTKPSIDEQEFQSLIGILKDIIAMCEKSVLMTGLSNQKLQKKGMLDDLKQTTMALSELTRR